MDSLVLSYDELPMCSEIAYTTGLDSVRADLGEELLTERRESECQRASPPT